MTTIVTFFGALIFINNQMPDLVELIAFIVILLFNCWFFILWLYCMLVTYKYQILQRVTEKIRKLALSPELKRKETFYRTST